jgi:RNA polymerase sigma-70 factor (ECF subfamily)
MTPCKSEKQKAFEEQAIAHADVLYRFGISLTRNAADAEDLVQETYLKAYRFWEKYDQGTNIRAWLFRILKNSFINVYRKESKEPDMVDYCETMRPAASHEVAPDTHGHQELVFTNVFDDDVYSAVTDLTEDFRTVVILCDVEGLTYEEIALFVGCPLGTVRSRLHRGRKVLHSKLYEYARDRGYAVPVPHPGSRTLTSFPELSKTFVASRAGDSRPGRASSPRPKVPVARA